MKNVIITAIVALILSSAAAQGKSISNSVPLGEEFSLRVGNKVSIRDAKLKIRFISVLEDSRCPKGVQCVWQGNAKASFELSGLKRRPSTVRLNTGVDPHQVEYSEYIVKLVKLTPERKSGEKISKRSYEATLVISRR